MESKTYVKLLVYSVLLLCAFTISLNIYVNPYGYYGDKSLGTAHIFNAQQAKLNYISQMSNKPDAFVLGSSNSMRIRPSTVDSLFNVKSFNYGVYQASIEDIYCISHALIDRLKLHPKLFIICIDDWNFSNYKNARDNVFLGAQNRLSYKSDLSKYLPNYSSVKLFWSRFKSGLSYEQIKLSFGKLKEAYKKNDYNRNEIQMASAFYFDGTRKKYTDEEGTDITQLAEAGKYNIAAYLKKRHIEELKKKKEGIFSGSHEDFQKIQPERLELFNRLISYLDENNVNVIINIMPMQPYYKKLTLQYTQYNKRITELKKSFYALSKAHKNILLIKDNSDIVYFNGIENQFFDHIHPTYINSDLMLYSIKKHISNNAVQ